jgi:hypothetical protein
MSVLLIMAPVRQEICVEVTWKSAKYSEQKCASYFEEEISLTVVWEGYFITFTIQYFDTGTGEES